MPKGLPAFLPLASGGTTAAEIGSLGEIPVERSSDTQTPRSNSLPERRINDFQRDPRHSICPQPGKRKKYLSPGKRTAPIHVWRVCAPDVIEYCLLSAISPYYLLSAI
jgi:hypothetical protein